MIDPQIQMKTLAGISTDFKLLGNKLCFEVLTETLFKSIIYFDQIYGQFVILYQISNSGGELEKPVLVGNALEERISVEFHDNQMFFKLLPCGIDKQLELIEYLSLVRRELGVDLLAKVDIQKFYAAVEICLI
jgi:hypothetical protein